MAIEGSNLQGANVRQVVVQADAAVQAQIIRRDMPSPESVTRPFSQMGERLQAERNQSVGDDLFVQKQDEEQKYSAGDALNGNGRRDQEKSPKRQRSEDPENEGDFEGDAFADAEWSELGDPREAQERLIKGFADLAWGQAGDVFTAIDRHLLSGLMLPDVPAGRSGGVAAYQRQNLQIQPAPDAFRTAVQGAQRSAEIYSECMEAGACERARKLVSLARQGVRTSSVVGRELAGFLDEALLEVSRPDAAGALKAVGLLAVVESAISLWRESLNVGTVLPWSLH